MKLFRIVLLSAISVFGTMSVCATEYIVEARSQHNMIDLEVANKSGMILDSISVAITKQPTWCIIKQVQVDNRRIPIGGLCHVSIEFDVSPLGTSGVTSDISIAIETRTLILAEKSIALTLALPKVYAMQQNYPNPFNPTTTIEYQLPADGRVTIKLYDILGQEVATLIDEDKKAGYNRFTFDGRGLATGTYFYRMTSGKFVESKKMLLLK